ncbi:hypothetical protein CC86DRAFT_369427 [Ophiobolus disseminans]|uniref:Uncharacterized protein n=1 Tax=Ophiobolus disseminans TaxID=1469910 RepID=A0A6A7A356_9PLEO|nr:hypothetical protein CC86DRAFT_369427 [Ophiobolus disseminans]
MLPPCLLPKHPVPHPPAQPTPHSTPIRFANPSHAMPASNPTFPPSHLPTTPDDANVAHSQFPRPR